MNIKYVIRVDGIENRYDTHEEAETACLKWVADGYENVVIEISLVEGE